MARIDPTFTGGDVIRFWVKNLDNEEQADVFSVMVFALSLATARKVPTKFFLFLLSVASRILPKPWGLVLRIFLKIFKLEELTSDVDEFIARAQRVISQTGLRPADINFVVKSIENV